MLKINELSAEEFDEYVLANHPEANILQSARWGEVQEIRGFKVIRMGLTDGGQTVAAFQGFIRDAKRGRYLEIPGGPLINWTNSQNVSDLTDEIGKIAVKHKCVFARIRPQVEVSPLILGELKANNFHKSPFHLNAEHTILLDLDKSEEQLLSNMRRQTRYEIRRALKDKDIRVGNDNDIKTFQIFRGIQADTAKRQNFIPPGVEELDAIRRGCGDDATVYYASYQGTIHSMALVVRHGEEVDYLEAASTPEARKFPLAYALQWEIIRDARNAGYKRYNFWGIAATDDPKHRFANVTTFKKGFGGDITVYCPAHDLVINKPKYAINFLIETIRKKIRHL